MLDKVIVELTIASVSTEHKPSPKYVQYTDYDNPTYSHIVTRTNVPLAGFGHGNPHHLRKCPLRLMLIKSTPVNRAEY